MRLHDRMTKLEHRSVPATDKVIVMDFHEDRETEQEAIARYEAGRGPIYDPAGDVIRVLIRRFG